MCVSKEAAVVLPGWHPSVSFCPTYAAVALVSVLPGRFWSFPWSLHLRYPLQAHTLLPYLLSQCFFSPMTPTAQRITFKLYNWVSNPSMTWFQLSFITFYSSPSHTLCPTRMNQPLTFFAHVLPLLECSSPMHSWKMLSNLKDMLKHHFFHYAFLDLCGWMSSFNLKFPKSYYLWHLPVSTRCSILPVWSERKTLNGLWFLERKAMWKLSLIHLYCVTKISLVPSSSL